MAKTVNVISNYNNGAGLAQDGNLIVDLLTSWGYNCRKIQYDIPHTGISYKADLNIFLEVMLPDFLHNAPESWLFPNSEWWNKNGDCALPFISKVLCKTQDCFNIWNQKTPGKCVYTGFESADYFSNMPYEQKENNFLHLAGNSRTKNTEAVVEAWIRYNIPYNLELVIRDISWIPRVLGQKNIIHHGRLPEAHVQIALNARWFHIMPSHYEGFGHVLHEALGCGGIVLTTNAPPMNEIDGIPKELLIPSHQVWKKELANCHAVTPEGVLESVQKAVALSLNKRIDLSRIARQAFLKDREDFRNRFKQLFN